jgi:hypothetical protein
MQGLTRNEQMWGYMPAITVVLRCCGEMILNKL